jgi:eukaryotic-like serine/threonine-protein kinase
VLAHPNIVPVFDFGKVGDEYFMAEEFVVGRDITRLLQRQLDMNSRPLGERLMLYVAHEVLEALTYAHGLAGADGKSLGIVHRDISPGNIMVTARGDVKLLDFGIVKATGRVSRTEAGVVKGNVSFMSPEQARGEIVDARSDLFSLGLVIYYGLTSEQIYRASGTFEQLLQAASGPTPEDLSKVADLPAASRILARALAVDPTQRYQSAAAFAADLAPHVAGGRLDAAALMHGLFGDELRAASAG